MEDITWDKFEVSNNELMSISGVGIKMFKFKKLRSLCTKLNVTTRDLILDTLVPKLAKVFQEKKTITSYWRNILMMIRPGRHPTVQSGC